MRSKCVVFVILTAGLFFNLTSQAQSVEAASDILSSQIQSMLEDLPGLPVGFYYALDPTVPIFSLYGPLGWYDGY
jgi:hypothetical protein